MSSQIIIVERREHENLTHITFDPNVMGDDLASAGFV